MYDFRESKKLKNDNKDIIERLEKIKSEIDQSIKNFEVQVAEIISDKKLNDQLKHDIHKLGTIVNEVDQNLVNLRDMLK